MLLVIAHAIETVLLVTGVVALIRCAFQYASRTENWHQLNVVLFHVQSLSRDEMKWWYVAMFSLILGGIVRVLNMLTPA
ncbi:hypothetical protein RN22_18025 [Grimontia sp. AD028]|uniref:Uncharacterized protein n=1 Tax=Grimontia indica TaxID=1056512 RepID=R1GYI1_9GAMM|nr:MULTISPECIES: hypothetical protein [Grimontia]EOD81268.1 hypothetical protein D515_04169 [Grimontia indica]KKD59097.1 hypothetical protein RN22_18025 [Grimontia sp. AD028]